MTSHSPNTNLAHRMGFSLLELSISIAIIALLVTAVITGQSLRHRLELNRLIEDIGLLNTAAKNYKNAYAGSAGDSYNAEFLFGQENVGDKLANSNGDGNGDGDNKLEEDLLSPARNEKLLFWQHLAAAGLINGTYDGTSLGSDGMYVSPFADIFYQPNTNNNDHNKLYFLVSRLAGGVLENGAFTTQEAFDYDSKYDDGVPTTGTIQALDGIDQTANSCVTTDNKYNLTLTTKNICQLIFYVE